MKTETSDGGESSLPSSRLWKALSTAWKHSQTRCLLTPSQQTDTPPNTRTVTLSPEDSVVAGHLSAVMRQSVEEPVERAWGARISLLITLVFTIALSGLSPIIGALSDILTVGLAALVAAAVIHPTIPVRATISQLVAVLATTAFAVVTITTSLLVNSGVQTRYLTSLAAGILVLVAIVGVVDSKQAVDQVLIALGCAAALISTLAVLHAMGVPIPNPDYPSKPILNTFYSAYGPVGMTSPDSFGIFVTIGILAWCYQLLGATTINANRLSPVLMILFCLLGLLASLNRSNVLILGGALSVLMYGLLPRRAQRWSERITLPIAGGLAAITVISLTMVEILPHPIVSNLGERLVIMEDALEFFFSHPIVGGGLGSFPAMYGTHAHNSFLALLANTGLVGFTIFSIVLLAGIAESIRSKEVTESPLPWVTLAALVAFVIGNFFYVGIFYSPKPTWLIIAIGVLAPYHSD